MNGQGGLVNGKKNLSLLHEAGKRYLRDFWRIQLLLRGAGHATGWLVSAVHRQSYAVH